MLPFGLPLFQPPTPMAGTGAPRDIGSSGFGLTPEMIAVLGGLSGHKPQTEKTTRPVSDNNMQQLAQSINGIFSPLPFGMFGMLPIGGAANPLAMQGALGALGGLIGMQAPQQQTQSASPAMLFRSILGG